MNADTVAIIVKTSTSGAKTTVIVLYPQESGDVKVDVETIKTQSVTCSEGVTVYAHVGTSAASTAQTGDSYAIVNSGTYGNSALKTLIDTVDDFVDTEVAAIKAKTDNLPATPASAADCITAAGVRTAVGLATANLDTQLSAIAGYIDTEVSAIKSKTDNLPSDPADASDIATAFGTVNSTLATIAAYVDTEVAAIKAKTDNLPANPAASGDIPSATTIASQVRTELATELARIDVATSTRLASSSYVAPLDAAGVRSAVGLASANLDTQLADLPTNSELSTALAGADDATLAAIAALSIPTTTQIADAVLSRSVSNVEGSAAEHTLCTVVLAMLESSVSGTAWTIKRTDGSTTHATKTVTTDATAHPITGVS